MIVIVCVDQKNGMLFNHRRQSQDRAVRHDIINMAAGALIWMNEYSSRQFQEDEGNFCVDDDFLDEAGDGEYCFVENQEFAGKNVERLILYRWDKNYPADMKLDLRSFKDSRWKMAARTEFGGYSHEVIIKEEYERVG